MQKRSEYLKDVPYKTEVLSNVSSDSIWNNYLKPITEEKEYIKQKLFLESVRNDKDSKAWSDKVEKLLYDIKRNPKTNKYYMVRII